MSHTIFATLAATGFGVAFFHAAIPTHWLPFVLTARVQHWNRGKTILVTALAGSGHVLATAFLGLCITWFGTTLSGSIGDWFPRIAGGALLLFGLYYVLRQLRGHGHVHFPYPHEHLHESGLPDHDHAHQHEHEHVNGPHHTHAHDDGHTHGHDEARGRTSDRAAIVSLLAFLTFSPCEGFLPFYVSGIRYGWSGFAILTAILSVATVLGMVLFTSLTLIGLGRIKLAILEKYESLVMGLLLCIVGLLILLFEH